MNEDPMDPMDAVVRRLRAERETSPWWNTGPPAKKRTGPPEHPEPGSLWDDSETNTARRRALLERAARRMETREDTA